MVGSVMPKLKTNKKFLCKDGQDLIRQLRFQQFRGGISETYMDTFVPELLRHTDRGALSLIQEPFFPVAQALMKFCMEAAAGRHGYRKQLTWKQNGLETARHDETLLSQFNNAVLTVMGDDYVQRNGPLIKAFWQRLAEGTFRAYAKAMDAEDFTNSQNSLNNVEFRHQIACGASEKPKKKKSSKEKKRKLSTMMSELNQRASSTDDSASASSSDPAAPATVAAGTTTSDTPSPDNAATEATASSSNPAAAPATLAARGTTTDTRQGTTPDAQGQPPAAKKPRNKRRSKEEFKAHYTSIHGKALLQFDAKKGVVDDVSKSKKPFHPMGLVREMSQIVHYTR